VDPRMIHLYSYYREAELRGATLLLKLIMRVDDPESQVKLSRHLADETRHAWLWTKRIADLGSTPVQIEDGYQVRIGKEVGIPRTLIDLFALTVVVEERAQRRYLEHARRPNIDPETRELLHEVTKDEKWHIGWIKNKLKDLAAENGGRQRRAKLRIEARTLTARADAGEPGLHLADAAQQVAARPNRIECRGFRGIRRADQGEERT